MTVVVRSGSPVTVRVGNPAAESVVAGYVGTGGALDAGLDARIDARAVKYVSIATARAGDAFPIPMSEYLWINFGSSSQSYTNRKVWPLDAAMSVARGWGAPVIGVTGTTIVGPDAVTYDTYGDTNTGGSTASPVYWEFLTDAPKFEVFGALHSGSPIYAEVDGRAYVKGAQTPSNSYMRFVFSTSPRRLRRVRVYANEGMKVAAIITDQADTVMPTAGVRPRLGLMTDSYGQGSVNASSRPHSLAYIFGESLGVDLHKNSVGGTGYQTASGVNDYLTRTSDFDGVSLSAMMWWGGINDPSTGLQAAAEACFSAFATAHPGTPQIALGPWSPSATYEAANAAKWTAIEAACAAQGVVFIDNRGWITGTGKYSAKTGDGNADALIRSDGTHPTSPDDSVTEGIGTTVLAQRTANAVRQLIMNGELS